MMFIKLIITTIIYLSFPSYFVSPLSTVRHRNSSDNGSRKWHVFIFHLFARDRGYWTIAIIRPSNIHLWTVRNMNRHIHFHLLLTLDVWIQANNFFFSHSFVGARDRDSNATVCLCSVKRRIACVLVWKIVILIFVFIDIFVSLRSLTF